MREVDDTFAAVDEILRRVSEVVRELAADTRDRSGDWTNIALQLESISDAASLGAKASWVVIGELDG